MRSHLCTYDDQCLAWGQARVKHREVDRPQLYHVYWRIMHTWTHILLRLYYWFIYLCTVYCGFPCISDMIVVSAPGDMRHCSTDAFGSFPYKAPLGAHLWPIVGHPDQEGSTVPCCSARYRAACSTLLISFTLFYTFCIGGTVPCQLARYRVDLLYFLFSFLLCFP